LTYYILENVISKQKKPQAAWLEVFKIW